MKEPLAFRARPQTIDDIIGQEHLLGKNQILRNMVENQDLYSMIFFGPPGTGKTTTAMAIAQSLNRPFRLFNAVSDNKKKLDQLFIEAEMSKGLVVIIDEVHRLNKDKQDVLLPHIESGLITMMGATTANPYFSINPAIRSRVHLFEFKPLTENNIQTILKSASSKTDKKIDAEVFESISKACNGDARYALNALELLISSTHENEISLEDFEKLSLSVNITMDKDSDHHHDAMSAFQKSIRGSDVQAALYYLAKLIHVGDFDSIERRLIATAYEDIGLANPALCARVVTALEAARKIGFPEARLPIADVVIECALSPKSKSGEHAIDKAIHTVKTTAHQVPLYLRLNAVNLDKEDSYDYGRNDLWHKIQYLPDELANETFYEPQNLNSQEKTLKANLDALSAYKRSNQLRQLKKNK